MGFLDRLLSSLGGKKGKRLKVRDRFELLREAISGTMSKFYMARDRKSGQIVGLKLLNPEKTAAFEERFKGLKKPSEGEIAVQLKHPNIVETYEYGKTTDGEQYLVMEYIEGPGLNFIITDSFSVLDGIRVPLIRQIASALGAVHAAGFIHRDICPRNLMVEPNSGVLKLIDFGLTIPNKPEFLQPGNRTGNPNYMAPEVSRRKKTDHRVDIFALGVTAYEILSGQLPWVRGNDGKAAMDHASKPPADLRQYRPKVDSTLEEAVLWCLKQEPAERCPNTEEFLKRIQRIEQEDAE